MLVEFVGALGRDFSGLAAQAADRLVADDTQQPRPQARPALEIAESGNGLEPGLLYDLLGAGVADDRAREALQRRMMVPHHRAKRALLARAQPPQEFGILHGRLPAPDAPYGRI